MCRTFLVLAVALACCADGVAFAQGPYVSASVGVDVSRISHVEAAVYDVDGGGEAWSWALRVGAPVGVRWGVELEFVRAAELEDELASPRFPLAATELTSPAGAGAIPPQIPIVLPFEVRMRRRHSAIAPLAWIRTDVSDRVGIVFLGGIAFNRTTTDVEYGFAGVPGILRDVFPPITPPAVRTVGYGTGAVAGVEGRIGLTGGVQLVPAVRLQGVDGGWIVRPAVGLGWQF